MDASSALLAPRAVVPARHFSPAHGRARAFLLARGRARFDLPAMALAFALCALSSLLAGTPAARADAQALPAGYSEIIDEAVAEATRGNFVEARALFARAHTLYPNARTLRGLGMMAYELRDYAEAVSYYERALASKERPLDANLRADAEEQLKRARRFVAEIKLALTPPATRVLVDRQPVELPSPGLLRLDPGAHNVTFEAPGYRAETRAVEVRGGESLLWTITLRLAGEAPVAAAGTSEGSDAPATSAPPRDEPRRPLAKNPWLWTGVVVAVAAIATGVGIAVARDDKKTVEEEPQVSANSPNMNPVIRALVRQ